MIAFDEEIIRRFIIIGQDATTRKWQSVDVCLQTVPSGVQVLGHASQDWTVHPRYRSVWTFLCQVLTSILFRDNLRFSLYPALIKLEYCLLDGSVLFNPQILAFEMIDFWYLSLPIIFAIVSKWFQWKAFESTFHSSIFCPMNFFSNFLVSNEFWILKNRKRILKISESCG